MFRIVLRDIAEVVLMLVLDAKIVMILRIANVAKTLHILLKGGLPYLMSVNYLYFRQSLEKNTTSISAAPGHGRVRCPQHLHPLTDLHHHQDQELLLQHQTPLTEILRLVCTTKYTSTIYDA